MTRRGLNLREAIAEVTISAEDEHQRTRTFPSVYRELAELGFRWFKVHRYWF